MLGPCTNSTLGVVNTTYYKHVLIYKTTTIIHDFSFKGISIVIEIKCIYVKT